MMDRGELAITILCAMFIKFDNLDKPSSIAATAINRKF
jgi:hypothetical protein